MTYSIWSTLGGIYCLERKNVRTADSARLIAINYVTDRDTAIIMENDVIKYIVLQKLRKGKRGNMFDDYAYICVTVKDINNRKLDKYAHISKKTGKLYR